MKIHVIIVGSAMLLVALLTGCGNDPPAVQAIDGNGSPVADQDDGLPKPSPELTPADVVRIQLEALRKNDASNSGIAVAYRFASPRNRNIVGPIERFELMLRDARYAAIMNYKEVEFMTSALDGDAARQVVVLATANGETHCYLFVLSRQPDEPYRDCWMTDAVICEEDAG